MNADFITVSDIISIFSLLVVIIGGVFTYIQWKNNVSLNRANYINELTEKIRTDESIKDTVYLLDYGKKWYSREFHGDKEIEPKVDKTLSYFSYICYLKAEKIISKKEFMFFKYEVERFLMNEQVQDYFYNLYHFANKFDIPFTFYYLFRYGEQKGVFDKQFFDMTSYKVVEKYHRYLNF